MASAFIACGGSNPQLPHTALTIFYPRFHWQVEGNYRVAEQSYIAAVPGKRP